MSMRSLGAENLKLTADLARLTDKHTEAQRKADLATAAESALRTQLKSAEAQARALKEDVARMKALVAQSRSSCATEIRRRDRQIDTLKKQLGEAGRSRGTRGNPAVTTITVTGDVGGHEGDTTGAAAAECDGTLRREANATLANLAQLLTDENDAMLGVLQRTMAQLRDMSGWVSETREDEQVRRRPSCEDMAAELDSVMDHMRLILTNPSFVPIEEVVAREEEIDRLKQGWVKMEDRWKEAVHLMDGWRRRMAVSGRPVCDEDLQMGMRLSPVRVSGVDDAGRDDGMADRGLPVVKEESDEENAHQHVDSPCRVGGQGLRPDHAADEVPASDSDHPDREADSSDSDGDAAHHDDDNDPPESSPRNSTSARHRAESSDRGPDGDDNPPRARASTKSMRSQPVRPSRLPGNTHNPKKTPVNRPRPPRSSPDAMPPTRAEPPQRSFSAPQPRETPGSPNAQTTSSPARRSAQSPTLSNIAAKLAASEREADAARLRAKLKAARSSTTGVSRPPTATGPPDTAQPEKRKRDRKTKAASRRRSTLSPWELQTLIAGDAGA
ncbi:hypothetical protein E4U53_003472 [Claviceps sorghi]|nr:hypothetical protein E4U53_003472 [Claviceps sorghi]